MNESPPFVFYVLMAMVFMWFAMIIALFRRLKVRHYEKYNEMGEPSLLWNNSMKTGWTTIKFLFKREHKHLGDRSLTILSDFMLVFFALYTVLFFGLIFGI